MCFKYSWDQGISLEYNLLQAVYPGNLLDPINVKKTILLFHIIPISYHIEFPQTPFHILTGKKFDMNILKSQN